MHVNVELDFFFLLIQEKNGLTVRLRLKKAYLGMLFFFLCIIRFIKVVDSSKWFDA